MAERYTDDEVAAAINEALAALDRAHDLAEGRVRDAVDGGRIIVRVVAEIASWDAEGERDVNVPPGRRHRTQEGGLP
jgi:hypothetical protein